MKDGSFVHEYSIADFIKISETERISLGLRSIKEDDLKLKEIAEISTDVVLVENLKVSYGKKFVVNIDKLKIPKNSVVAIIGENGAGKSSLASCLCGILKTKSALIDSKKLNAKKQNKEAFMVMQDVNNQLFCESTLDEIISLTDENEEIVVHAKEVLDKLNLLEYADIHPLALSGGQKQRLVIATALFLNKKYLIFDEPTSGLDYNNMIRVSHILKELKKSVLCLLVITHDMELVHSCADYVLSMKQGSIVSTYTVK